MILLVTGIILWAAVHLFKRFAPTARDRLIEKFGLGPVKLTITVLSFAALALIIFGFRAAPFVTVFDPPIWGIHVNNGLMIIAVVLFGLGNSRGRLRPMLRHPMLTGVIVWGTAHLLVNGDMASVVLFGSMLVWAIVEIIAINAAEGAWTRPEPGPAIYDLRLLAISAVVFAVITFIHGLIGPSPFPG
jgi:uncharacterized membrane protein